jgi:hypothetical protein
MIPLFLLFFFNHFNRLPSARGFKRGFFQDPFGSFPRASFVLKNAPYLWYIRDLQGLSSGGRTGFWTDGI